MCTPARAESKYGKRLSPRKADLHRWRETFAEKLRGHGVEAEATRQATRGRIRNYESLWRIFESRQGARFANAVPLDTGDAQTPLDIVTPFMAEREQERATRWPAV